jgi:hypothetical protein
MELAYFKISGSVCPEAKASVSFGELIFQRLKPSEKTAQGKI